MKTFVLFSFLALCVISPKVFAAPGPVVPALFVRDTTCTINSGQGGVCISTSSCSSSGGQPEAGHCAGDADIQVNSSSYVSLYITT